MHNYSKQFIKLINEEIDCRKRVYEKFTDFCNLAFYSLANSVYKSDSLEQKYMSIIRKYSREDANNFAQLLGITIAALEENPEQDFLGQLYMELEIGNPRSGQYFTPYILAQGMTELNCQGINEIITDKGYITAQEPACGSGIMMIALRNLMVSKGYHVNNLFVQCIDVDFLCFCMCYIQLSLLGVAGTIIHGNSLSGEHYFSAYTVPYFASQFPEIHRAEKMFQVLSQINKAEKVEKVEETEEVAEVKQPVKVAEVKPKQQTKELAVPKQLSLFDFGM
ncbi:MAG: N-6 DNA methylase [Microcoleaceae cyanobacterium]